MGSWSGRRGSATVDLRHSSRIVILSEGGFPPAFGVPGAPGVGALGQRAGNPREGPWFFSDTVA
jgi:hypothetical protein